MIALQLGPELELAALSVWQALIAELEAGKDPLAPAEYPRGLRKRLGHS